MTFRDDGAWGVGVATVTTDDQVLDVWFPAGSLGLSSREREPSVGEVGTSPVVGLRREVREVVITSLAERPHDVLDAYLRLHLLSHLIVAPHEANLEGIFGVLPTVAWTSSGPCSVDRLDELRHHERSAGRWLTVHGIDKFPRLVDYVVPRDVRIADGSRVRLGAHLAPGTTVMHEGFVNFNAGTLGPSMIEGRVSAGVIVGVGSDVGGGASIMGTLSGGGTEVIRIDARCLIGANAGVGISLGDDCVVEAGCYVTSSAKVTLADGRTTKASELSGRSGLTYRRNSVSGRLEALPRSDPGV